PICRRCSGARPATCRRRFARPSCTVTTWSCSRGDRDRCPRPPDDEYPPLPSGSVGRACETVAAWRRKARFHETLSPARFPPAHLRSRGMAGELVMTHAQGNAESGLEASAPVDVADVVVVG